MDSMNAPNRNPVEAEQRDGPSLFVGIELEVNEIIICRNRVNAACATMREGIEKRYEAAVKQATDEIAQAAAQMSTMAAHVARMIALHQARNPKLPK
jgi:hypothetical protein